MRSRIYFKYVYTLNLFKNKNDKVLETVMPYTKISFFLQTKNKQDKRNQLIIDSVSFVVPKKKLLLFFGVNSQRKPSSTPDISSTQQSCTNH